MEFRKAIMQDLPQIKSIYRKIIEKMDKEQIQIWDDIYPCEFFEEDIRNGCLYLMTENSEICSAFVLCDVSAGEKCVEWENSSARALYLDRLGVNTACQGKGIGSLMLEKAKKTAKVLGAEYLRLFVVDVNVPAIRLYEKNGFRQVNGVYDELIDEDYVLREYGFEVKL